MEIWPTANYEHLYFVEIEIAAGMFAVIESLMCDQFDHLMMICHVCWVLLLDQRHAKPLAAGKAWGSLDSDASFCYFLCGNNCLCRAETSCIGAVQFGAGSAAENIVREESQSALGSTGIKPLTSQTLLRRHLSAVGWFMLCCERILVCQMVIQPSDQPWFVSLKVHVSPPMSHNFAKTSEHRSAVAGIWVRVRLTWRQPMRELCCDKVTNQRPSHPLADLPSSKLRHWDTLSASSLQSPSQSLQLSRKTW